MFRPQLEQVSFELPLIYSADHLQSTSLQNLSIAFYGPEMLVLGEIAETTIMLRNDGNEALRDIQVAIISPTGNVRIERDENPGSNALRLDSLQPGATWQDKVRLTTTTRQSISPTLNLDLLINYRSGGLKGQMEATAQTVSLLDIGRNPQEGSRPAIQTQIVVSSGGKQDLILHTAYITNDSQDRGRATGEIKLQVRCLQPVIEGLSLSLYDAEINTAFPAIVKCSDSNRVQIPTMAQDEVVSIQCMLSPGDIISQSVIKLAARMDYRVAREPETLTTQRLPGALRYRTSTYSRAHGSLTRLLGILQGSSKTTDQWTSAITKSIAALVALAAAIGIGLKPVVQVFSAVSDWIQKGRSSK
jgi:hypothetical protein